MLTYIHLLYTHTIHKTYTNFIILFNMSTSTFDSVQPNCNAEESKSSNIDTNKVIYSDFDFQEWMEDATHTSESAYQGAVHSVPDACRMVFVVRKDLKMSAGKVANQCSHASGAMTLLLAMHHLELLKKWMSEGMIKIIYKAEDETQFNDLIKQTVLLKYPFYVVKDAGKTQIESGSNTVLCIGPATKQALESITQSLKLY